jgi:hypothetical protein
LTPTNPVAPGGITASGFDDADGLVLAEPEWFWERLEGATWVVFDQGIGRSSTSLTVDELGLQIRVRIEYEDDLGGGSALAAVISAPTAPVAPAAP